MAVGAAFSSVKMPSGLSRKDAKAFTQGRRKTSKKEMETEWLAYLHTLGEATLVKAQENAPEGTGKLKKSVRLELHNNAKKLLPNYDVSSGNTGVKISPKETEYNKPEVVQTSKWVDPYTKLDAKTNRYRKVKGYWKKTEAPVAPPLAFVSV